MLRQHLTLGLTLTALAATRAALAQSPAQYPTAELRTSDTVLTVQAGETAPSVLSLAGPGSPWQNRAPETLISSAVVEGKTQPLHWKLAAQETRTSALEAVFVYESEAPHLRLTWQWSVPANYGPLQHRITIQNLDAEELWIPLQPSFQFRFAVSPRAALDAVSIEKGSGKPSPVGTHIDRVPTGYHWTGTSSTYATDEGPREVIPWLLIQRGQGTPTDGWYTGIEFSGRTALTLGRDSGSIFGTVGLNPDPAPFMTRLAPNASFETPPVFVGAFRGDRDDAGNVLRRWVREVLTHPKTWADPHYPLLVNNSWGSGMQVDEALAQHMIQDSAELGLEMFHIDAGWFRGVGDWYPDPKKFPRGLAVLSDEAHRRGLKFGIWVDWAQAGTSPEPAAASATNPKMRDWLIADTPPAWKPDDFVGRTMDLGFPPVKQFAQAEVERIVSSYKLDMLEHDGYLVAHACTRSDHPHAAPPANTASTVAGSGIKLPLMSNSTDVSYHAVRAYYDIYRQLRQNHPDLLLEVCNDGGRMVDFGSASHADYFSITDTYDPLSNRQAFYDTSQLLPAAMLEDYVEKWPTPNIQNFRYMLRSGMMGWLTIMQDTNQWTPEQHTAAKAEFALYKQRLRPLIRDADLYHVSPRPDGVHWDAIEFYDPRRMEGVVYAFRGSVSDEPEHAFALRGLNPERLYRLSFEDGSSAAITVSGRDLLTRGLSVKLSVPQSSELVFIQEVGR